MATDDDRREVARRLRESAENGIYTSAGHVLADIFGISGNSNIFNRLADLIEPDTTKPGSDTTKCDRDALLALADKLECDGDCNGCDMGGGIWCGAQVYAACRIREALGVSDD